MLKLRNLIENDEIAEELLKNYDFKNVKYGFCRSSSNVVYWVNGDGKLYFLRYTTKDERTIERVQAEVDYILYLRDHKVNANRPVKTKQGTYVITWENYIAVLFDGASGENLEDVTMNPEIAREWGRQLGQIHKLSSNFSKAEKDLFKRPDYKEKLFWIRTILSSKGDTDILRRVDEIEDGLNALPQTSSNYGLCHYDFELDNVYYDEQTKQFSIIDFDDSMYHFYAVDYAQVMMNIEEDLPKDIQSWVKEEFNKGYQEYHILPSIQEVQLACKFVQLFGIARITYCLDNPPEEMPDWMEEVIEKLSIERLKKREWLDLGQKHKRQY